MVLCYKQAGGKLHTSGLDMAKKWSQNCTNAEKLSQHGTKVVSTWYKWEKNGLNMVQKWSQHGAKVGPNVASTGASCHFGRPQQFWPRTPFKGNL